MQGTGTVLIVGFVSVCRDFVQKVTLVRRNTLGCHPGTGGVDQPLHRLITILFFAAVYGRTGQDHTMQPVPMMRCIGFFFRFVRDCLLGHASPGSFALNGY